MVRQFPAATIQDLLPERSGPNALIHQFDSGMDSERFTQLMQPVSIDPTGCFFAAACFGIRPDYAQRSRMESYSEFSIMNLCMYRDAEASFRERKLGFEAFRNMYLICIVGVFPEENREDYRERFIRPMVIQLEKTYEVPILTGLGLPVDDPSHIAESCRMAEQAFKLYFFESKLLIDLREYSLSRNYALDEYNEAHERAFRAILIQDSEAIERILDVLDVLARFHYGDQPAMLMHTMEFTGTLTSRLRRYRMLDVDFFELQTCLEEQVLNAPTFLALKEVIRQHFQTLLPRIYTNDRIRGKLVIEQVKDYIRDHYMEELNIRRLAAVAYVSPDYFSHLFKNETGKNYKAFLTEIRMSHAVDMLRETDYRVSEISEKVGYNNTRAFVDAFKHMFSVSPTEYRKIHKKR